MHLPKRNDREENNTAFDPFWPVIFVVVQFLVDTPGWTASCTMFRDAWRGTFRHFLTTIPSYNDV